MNYCDERDFRESTRMLVASLFKAALRAAQVEGITGPMPWVQECSAPSRSQTEAKKVWLNPEEIQALEELKLEPESPLGKARDIFLVGCYTGQRFSDYRRLTLTDIVTVQFDGKERHAFRKKQQKTGKEIYIPILNNKVLRILELWGEGFNWFDLKRWKDPLTRHTYADGGNFIASMAVSYPATGASSRNEWTWVIPKQETDYNPLITK